MQTKKKKRQIKVKENDFTKNKEAVDLLKKMIECEPVGDGELINTDRGKTEKNKNT